MITRQMSFTSSQVYGVLRDVINTVCKNNKKVTWHPRGISSAATYEIEPWRNISRKPFSAIKNHDAFSAAPYRLPDKVGHINPYFDHSTYYNPPRYNLRNQQEPPEILECLPIYPLTSVRCELSDDWLDDIYGDDDDDDDKKSGPQLVRTSPVPLCEVYKIVERLKKTEDYDKFIEESEI